PQEPGREQEVRDGQARQRALKLSRHWPAASALPASSCFGARWPALPAGSCCAARRLMLQGAVAPGLLSSQRLDRASAISSAARSSAYAGSAAAPFTSALSRATIAMDSARPSRLHPRAWL